MAETRTRMWSERGLVATFFLDLAADKTLKRWERFLSGISFSSAPVCEVPWSRSKLAGVDAIVEPNFGAKGFGAPDVIARLDFVEGAPAVLILEAKLCKYRNAAWRPSRRGERRYNSRLNGQLELNHRLAQALAAYKTGPLSEDDRILDTPYRCEGITRSVEKPLVLRELALPFGRCAPDQYFHVALTTDVSNPFCSPQLRGLFPEMFEPGKQEVSEGAIVRLGWTNWNDITAQTAEWDRSSLYHETLTLNRDRFPAIPTSGDMEGETNVKGVMLIYAPSIDNETVLHFSWGRGKNCVLRNYRGAVSLPETRAMLTSYVGPQIRQRWKLPRTRTSDIHMWRQYTEQLNSDLGLI